MNWKIPLFDLRMDHEEEAALRDVIRDGWLTMSARTAAFEAQFRERTGARFALAVTNGTAALHLACLAAGLKPGDEAICPSLSFVASAHAIQYTGATPVFAESHGEADLNIDPEDIRRKITPRTRAVLAVHLAGFPCDLEEIEALCGEHNLTLIEDCAHSLFSRYKGKRLCGRAGRFGCFSFFSNKNMSTGEGGMLITDDESAAEQIALLRSHGMTSVTLDRHKGRVFNYDVPVPGFNYRIDELRAALGLVQLKKLDAMLAKRRALYDYYLERIDRLPLTVPFQKQRERGDEVGVHIFPAILPKNCDRQDVMSRLRDKGIQTSVHYPPIHLFSEFKDEGIHLPVTESLAQRELTLPFYPDLLHEEVDYIVEALEEILQ